VILVIGKVSSPVFPVRWRKPGSAEQNFRACAAQKRSTDEEAVNAKRKQKKRTFT
jgi:hypothetical protein